MVSTVFSSRGPCCHPLKLVPNVEVLGGSGVHPGVGGGAQGWAAPWGTYSDCLLSAFCFCDLGKLVYSGDKCVSLFLKSYSQLLKYLWLMWEYKGPGWSRQKMTDLHLGNSGQFSDEHSWSGLLESMIGEKEGYFRILEEELLRNYEMTENWWENREDGKGWLGWSTVPVVLKTKFNLLNSL